MGAKVARAIDGKQQLLKRGVIASVLNIETHGMSCVGCDGKPGAGNCSFFHEKVTDSAPSGLPQPLYGTLEASERRIFRLGIRWEKDVRLTGA